MTIPPALIEPLARKIVNIFSLKDIDLILKARIGEELYHLAARGNPDPDTVSELLDRLSARSIERPVLGEMLARRPNDAELAALIEQAAPGVGPVAPSTEVNVASLVQGLDAVRARLGDPAVRAALTSSQAELGAIAAAIDSLDAYKSLHECLHQLQAKQFRTLREAARNLPDNPAEAAELRVFRNQLRNACVFAGDAVGKLPDVLATRLIERLWIKDLEAAGDEFHQAIQARDSGAARKALNAIGRIMRSTPPRLNTQIFAVATGLPLEDLARALEQVSAAGGGAPVQSGVEALRALIPAIRARVVEHRDWQESEIRIAELDQIVERSSPQVIEEFAEIWMELKAMVLELAARDGDAAWAHEIADDIRLVDDSLAAEQADAQFQDAFLVFRGDAQYRFLIVDSRLKADCTELVKIGEPLNRILAELGE